MHRRPFAGKGAVDEGGVGQLLRHQLAERKQCLVEALQEQGEPEQHVGEAGQHLSQLGDRLADDQELEAEDDAGNRQHIEYRLRDRRCKMADAHCSSIP